MFIYSNSISYHQKKQETTQTSFNLWMEKLTVVCIALYTLGKKDKLLVPVTT